LPRQRSALFEQLAQLSTIATRLQPDVPSIIDACDLIRETLAAEDAYVICAGDPHFLRIGSDLDPTDYEMKQKGYWLAWREIASRPEAAGGLFRIENRLLEASMDLAPGNCCTHFACILPGDESNSEMLIVKGPWSEGIGQDELTFLLAARPMMAYLVANALDTERRHRQREQFASVADIARAFTEPRDAEEVTSSVATAVARASGFDWVTIFLFDRARERVVESARNRARHSDSEIAGLMPRDDSAILEIAEHIERTGRPVIWPDVFSARIVPELADFYQRAHILSNAIFPLAWQGGILGLVYFSSSTRRSFDPDEVAFLETLVSQATTTLAGTQLYRELEEASRIQHFLARTDALTGIPNRRYIDEVLKAEAARAERYAEPMSIFIADLDHFKRLNDAFGHQAGDEALKHVASLARQSCRDADFVGRWGGDEFLFILPCTAGRGARAVAERFRQAVHDTDFEGTRFDSSLRLSVSAGVAEARRSLNGIARLIDAADAALYRAKEFGRNRVVIAGARAVAA
jgi:diguanylate cyclase (GGDEF)-like protein